MGSAASHTVCCVLSHSLLPRALLLHTLYAVYCHMLVSWGTTTFTYCKLCGAPCFMPWALLLCSKGTLHAVYCYTFLCHGHYCFLAIIVCCLLLNVLCCGHCCSIYCMLCTDACFVPCALLLMYYMPCTVTYFMLWALLLHVLCAVYCCMFVLWALLLQILQAVYCRIFCANGTATCYIKFLSQALLLCSMGTVALCIV